MRTSGRSESHAQSASDRHACARACTPLNAASPDAGPTLDAEDGASAADGASDAWHCDGSPGTLVAFSDCSSLMAFTELAGDFADEGGWCTWSSGDGRTSASLPFLRPTAHGVLHFGGLEFAGEAATILGNLVSVDHLPVRDECNALEFYTSDDVLYAVSSIGERCFVFAEMQRILMTPFTPGAHDVDITFAPGSVSLGVDDGGVSFRIDDGGSPDGPSDADTIHGTVQELNLFALVFSDAGRGSFQRVALDDVSVYSCEPP